MGSMCSWTGTGSMQAVLPTPAFRKVREGVVCPAVTYHSQQSEHALCATVSIVDCLHLGSHLILPGILQGRYCHPHFAEKVTEAQEGGRIS